LLAHVVWHDNPVLSEVIELLRNEDPIGPDVSLQVFTIDATVREAMVGILLNPDACFAMIDIVAVRALNTPIQHRPF